jgi:hypothetical protein
LNRTLYTPKHHRTTTIYLPKKSWVNGGFVRFSTRDKGVKKHTRELKKKCEKLFTKKLRAEGKKNFFPVMCSLRLFYPVLAVSLYEKLKNTTQIFLHKKEQKIAKKTQKNAGRSVLYFFVFSFFFSAPCGLQELRVIYTNALQLACSVHCCAFISCGLYSPWASKLLARNHTCWPLCCCSVLSAGRRGAAVRQLAEPASGRKIARGAMHFVLCPRSAAGLRIAVAQGVVAAAGPQFRSTMGSRCMMAF